MKTRRSHLAHQLLVILMAILVISITLQMAQAQVLQTNLPQKDLVKNIASKSSLSYYHQFLGPTLSGKGGESYNVFQESRTPYQSFHAASLRFDLNQHWAFGASLSAVSAYGINTTSQGSGFQGTMQRDEFFNARAFVVLPSINFAAGSLFTTLSYEAPTSVISRKDEMRYGIVLSQGVSFNLPISKLSSGISWQLYRAYFRENVKTIRPADYYFRGSYAEYAIRQTVIVNAGPYANYRFNDSWGINSAIVFDWDQRGNKTSTTNFNNNLPDRARLGVSYFPTNSIVSKVGLFTQALLKYTTDTQAFGAEFALIF